MKLSAQLRFDRVLLVGSYMIPQWGDYHRIDIEKRLKVKYRKTDIMFLHGADDFWKPCEQVRRLADHFRLHNIENCNHEASKTHAMTSYWSCLVKFV